MNKIIKRILIVVAAFLVIIPVAFSIKGSIEKRNNSKTNENEQRIADILDNENNENLKDNENDENKDAPQEIDSTIEEKDEKEETKENQEEIKEKNEEKPIGFLEAYDANEVKNNIVDSNYAGKKLAFLTFDDGVNTVTSKKILDILNANKLNATFFIPGFNLEVEENQDVLKELYEAGNSIGTHSYSHNYDILYPNRIADADVIVDEYNKTLELMKSILGEDFDTKLFRYPGGHLSWDQESLKLSDQRLEEIGVKWIDWNAMTGDAQAINAGPNDISRPQSVDQVLSNFDRSLDFTSNPNEVVILMHDALDKELTVNALQALIDHLKNMGYEFGILK